MSECLLEGSGDVLGKKVGHDAEDVGWVTGGHGVNCRCLCGMAAFMYVVRCPPFPLSFVCYHRPEKV